MAMPNRLLPAVCFTVAATLPLVATAQTAAEKARFTDLVALYQTAIIVGEPGIAACTLSGGAETLCLKITTVAAPSDHVTGPFCPRTITDSAEDGGTWFTDGTVRDVDGAFIAELAQIYGDDAWQMFDPKTGEVYRRAGALGCLVAGDPQNETGQPDNICVECELGYIGRTVTQTYFLPLEPVPSEDAGGRIGPQSGIGLAFNGVKFDAPAPLDLILRGHTLGPFDDCAGHINPSTGYHYHGILEDCGARVLTAVADHAAMIGVAMDGFGIFDRLDAAGAASNDLDSCGGHDVAEIGYHYHVKPPAKNQIIGCFAAQTGCSTSDSDAMCDAAADQRPPPRP